MRGLEGCLAALALWVGASAAAAPVDSGYWTPPVFSHLDSLFITAATGEPRFAPQREADEKALLALDTVTLRYLLDHRLIDQTPRQHHYVEHLFIALSDSGRRRAPGRMLAAALPGEPDSIRAQLLYIGSELGDTAFRRAALPWLMADSENVRRMAVRCLGAYPQSGNLPLLWNGLSQTRGLELQERLWALEAQGPLRDWKKLLPLLHDGYFFNRQKVRDLLLKATDSSWAALAPAVPDSLDDAQRREWCLLALDAKGGEAFWRRELPRLPVDERPLPGQFRRPVGNLEATPAR